LLLTFGVLLSVSACSSGSGSFTVTLENRSPEPGTDEVSSPAEPTEGLSAIFDVSATLRPGAKTGKTVRTRVDVTATNIGNDPAPLVGMVRLSDDTGIALGVVPGNPDGLILSFGTLSPFDTTVRTYEIDLPVGVTVTTVLVLPVNEPGFDGPVTYKR
jgi:hypothetical protein